MKCLLQLRYQCYIHAKICDDESARVAFYLIYSTVIFVFAHQFVHFLLPSKSLVIGDSKSRQTPEEIIWQACRSYSNTGHWSCELPYNQTPCSCTSSWKRGPLSDSEICETSARATQVICHYLIFLGI